MSTAKQLTLISCWFHFILQIFRFKMYTDILFFGVQYSSATVLALPDRITFGRITLSLPNRLVDIGSKGFSGLTLITPG